MDNVTHTLIGVVLGEAIARSHPERGRAWRTGMLWTCVLGSNLPDFDFLLRPIVGGGNLGYLLHHRGYTHTLLASVPLAAAAAAVGGWAARRTHGGSRPPGEPARADGPSWKQLGLAGMAAVLLHIAADFWNDYGVHPFWPAVKGWAYGDFIFIVEPLLWLAMLPFAFQASRARLAKALWLALGLGIFGLAWKASLMPRGVALGVTLWGAGVAAAQRRFRGWGVPAAGIFLVLATFAGASQLVRGRLLKGVPQGETLLQLATSPAPANPLCWRVILATRGAPDVTRYRARVGVATLPLVSADAPGWLADLVDPQGCHLRMAGDQAAPLGPVEGFAAEPTGLRIAWRGEFRGSLVELARLASSRCRVRGLLRFARMPFWVPSGSSPQEWIVGDLRYDREKGLGFAKIETGPDDQCLKWEPGWEAAGLRAIEGIQVLTR